MGRFLKAFTRNDLEVGWRLDVLCYGNSDDKSGMVASEKGTLELAKIHVECTNGETS